MVENVGVAVVGVRFVGGRVHVPLFRKMPESELVVLGARTERRVTNLSRKYDMKCYLNYDEIAVLWYPTSDRWDSR